MTDAERVGEATRSFLDDHPEAEDGLEQLVSLEEETGPWTFDDVPFDSGRFGELVSGVVVEKTEEGGYQFANRAAVEAVLAGEESPRTTSGGRTASSESEDWSMSVSLPAVDRTLLGAVAGVVALVAAVRSLYFSSVFRDEFVVSPGNDPYFYRYWQAELLEHSTSATDVGMAATVGEMTRIRPLTHALNWWFATLLGGTPDAAATVAAWLPVIGAVVLSLVLYGTVVTLSRDHRIALAAVLLFALMPVHVVYTALGFLEHRSYQYFFLSLMVFTLVWLAVDFEQRLSDADIYTSIKGHVSAPRSWAVASVLAIAVGASAHAWGGSPLTFGPVALYFATRVLLDTRRGVPALPANAPALAGVGVGSALAAMAHVRWDWHESIAATVPVGVAIGAVAVATLATVWHRLELPVSGLLATETVTGIVGAYLFRRFRPEDVTRLHERSDALFGRETAVETQSLFSTELAIIFGPLAQLGIGFYFALIPMGLATWYVYRRYEPGWLVVVCFAWYYLVLAAIQVRFAAQFAIFSAVFGGMGLVYLLSAVDITRKPTLFNRETAPSKPPVKLPETPAVGGYLAGIVVVALILNLIFVPTLLGQIQYSEDEFEAMMAIDEHAAEYDRDYPENFVLSEWGTNRMYNYFINNESRGYSYAQSNHEQFVTDVDPDGAADNVADRVGYVVLTEQDLSDSSTHAQLFDIESGEGPARYQLLYAAEDVRAFALVDGAVIEKQTANESATATTDVTAAGKQFTYQRSASADEDGAVAIRVAYPGEYDVDGKTVAITEEDVRDGETVSVEE